VKQTTNHVTLGTYTQPQNMLFYKNLNWPNMIMKAIWVDRNQNFANWNKWQVQQMEATGIHHVWQIQSANLIWKFRSYEFPSPSSNRVGSAGHNF